MICVVGNFFQELGIRNRIEFVRRVGANFDGVVRGAIRKGGLGHMLASRFFGPIPSRWSGDFVFLSDLGQSDVGNAVGFGQLGDRGFPNLFVQL